MRIVARAKVGLWGLLEARARSASCPSAGIQRRLLSSDLCGDLSASCREGFADSAAARTCMLTWTSTYSIKIQSRLCFFFFFCIPGVLTACFLSQPSPNVCFDRNRRLIFTHGLKTSHAGYRANCDFFSLLALRSSWTFLFVFTFMSEWKFYFEGQAEKRNWLI